MSAPGEQLPRVSVILTAWNRTGPLPGAIDSVLRQSFGDFELLVVDDGSSEDIESIVRSIPDPRLRYLRREHGGVAAARNTGVRAARGEYLAFQDSDDAWLPEKLARQVERMSAGEPVMVVCGLRRRYAQGERRYPSVDGDVISHDNVLQRPIAYTQTWLVRRQDVIDAGGFDESLQVWDDWELLIRLSMRLKIRLLPEILVESPVAGDGISREQGRFVHDMGRVLEKHAAHLQRHRVAHAQLQYLYARLLASRGRTREARGSLWCALRLRPLHWRAAALLAASVGGKALLQFVLSGSVRP